MCRPATSTATASTISTSPSLPGLPNRLYRNRGDSTFEDITDRAGLGVLDDTASSLFADVDNDGDEDLGARDRNDTAAVPSTTARATSRAADAFQFARPPQGVLTSMSAADYDRDGYVDLYLCVYSYFFGAGEDKAGTRRRTTTRATDRPGSCSTTTASRPLWEQDPRAVLVACCRTGAGVPALSSPAPKK